MPPRGRRHCTCELCGPRGQLVTVAIYRQHQQRQRRRTERASHADRMAFLANEQTGHSIATPTDSIVEQRCPIGLPASRLDQPTPHTAAGPPSTDRGGIDAVLPTAATTRASDAEADGTNLRAPTDLTASRTEATPPVDDGPIEPPLHTPPGSPTRLADGWGPSVTAHGAFGDDFFAEEDEAQADVPDEEVAEGDRGEIEMVDGAELYRPSTTYEGRISAGLIDPTDFPHSSRAVAALPLWQRASYIFVLWLCGRHHLSDQIGSTLLRFLDEVFVPSLATAGAIDRGTLPPLRVAMSAVKRSMGLEPSLVRYIVCPRCSNLYPWSVKDAIKTCSSCGADIHQPTALLPSLIGIGTTRPQVFYTVSPVRTWLETLMQCSEIEDALDTAFGRHAAPSTDETGARVYRDITDGDQWRAGLDRSGTPYASDPLSLYLTIGVDWFSPFKINNASWHSSGAITMMVNNLPDAMRHRNAHLAAVTPGPQETSEEALSKYLAPIVEELKVLDQGIWVRTPRNVQGRLLRARILLFCGDTPARTKALGFLGHRASSFCTTCLASKLVRHLTLRKFTPRDPNAHRADAIKARQEQVDPAVSKTAQEENARKRGAKWSQLYELSYWRAVTGAPPDAMHAVFLGIVKRFWHRFFVDAIVSLDADLLARPQACIAGYMGPLTMKRPDKRLGDRGGGNPNADQWCCLARNLLVFQFADLFDDALCRLPEDSDHDYVRAKFPKGSTSTTSIKRPYVEEAMRTSAANAAAVIESAGSDSNAEPVTPAAIPSAPTGTAGTAVPAVPVTQAGPASHARPTPSTEGHAEVTPAETPLAPSVNAAPAAVPTNLDVLLAKRDVFLLAMHVAAIAELVYASELTEADVTDLEAVTEGHLLLCRLISPLWPTVNTHYVLHLPEFIRRFGPCRGWWAFTFERMNGWLSEAAGRRSNRKRDGQVEYSMMRAFADRTATQNLGQAQSASVQEAWSGPEKALWELIGKKKGTRSTIDAQSDERVYRSHPKFDTVICNGTGREDVLTDEAVQSLVAYLNTQDGGDRYQPLWSFQPGRGTAEVRNKATFYSSFSLRGQRFVSLSFRSNAHQGSTFAVARRNGIETPCQIVSIFQHSHISAAGDNVTGQFVEIRWLEPIPWPENHPMRRHAVVTKHLRCSLAARPTPGPTDMIRAREIICQAAMTPCSVGGKPVLGVKKLFE